MISEDKFIRNIEILKKKISGHTVAKIASEEGLNATTVSSILHGHVRALRSFRILVKNQRQKMDFLLCEMAEISAQNSAMRKLLHENGIDSPHGASSDEVYLASIGLDARVFGSLDGAGIKTVRQINMLSDDDLLCVPGLGTIGLYKVRSAVAGISKN